MRPCCKLLLAPAIVLKTDAAGKCSQGETGLGPRRKAGGALAPRRGRAIREHADMRDRCLETPYRSSTPFGSFVRQGSKRARKVLRSSMYSLLTFKHLPAVVCGFQNESCWLATFVDISLLFRNCCTRQVREVAQWIPLFHMKDDELPVS